MDVGSTLDDALSGGVATLELAKMPNLVNGRLDGDAVDSVVKRTVKVGDDRSIRLYITDVVREALEQMGSGESEVELSLLVGPITGRRYGRFEAKAVPSAVGGAKATLTVLTRERYDPDGAD